MEEREAKDRVMVRMRAPFAMHVPQRTGRADGSLPAAFSRRIGPFPAFSADELAGRRAGDRDRRVRSFGAVYPERSAPAP